MKLIDILVRELPKRGGWPTQVNCIVQDSDWRIMPAKCHQQKAVYKDNRWYLDASRTGSFLVDCLADDYQVSIITREQYDSALASRASQISPMGTIGDAVAEAVNELELNAAKKNPYLREIKPGVWVDVYDVLNAWAVTNPALQHLLKKALQPGERGHKSREQDLQDIIDSAIRAKELEIK